MIAGKVVGLGFEIISKLDSYLLMTVQGKNLERPKYYEKFQNVSTIFSDSTKSYQQD